MSSNGFFSFTGFTGFDDNNLYYNSSSAADDLFSAFNNTGLDLHTHQHAGPSANKHEWYLRSPNAGGPSQPYTGAEVLENPDLDDPLKAPTSLHPAGRVSLDEGKSCRHPKDYRLEAHSFIIGHGSPFYSRMGILTFSPQLATTPLPPADSIPSPVPVLPCGCKCLLISGQFSVTDLMASSSVLLPQLVHRTCGPRG